MYQNIRSCVGISLLFTVIVALVSKRQKCEIQCRLTLQLSRKFVIANKKEDCVAYHRANKFNCFIRWLIVLFHLCITENVVSILRWFNKGKRIAHEIAVRVLVIQRICLQHLDTSRCCRPIRWWHFAVDLL
jgi:hypothetical protein